MSSVRRVLDAGSLAVRRSPPGLVGFALAATFAAGLLLGWQRPSVTIHTGMAHSAPGAISIEADGWFYAVPLDGVEWVDATGAWHDSGRPACLPPTGTDRPITFGAVDAGVEGVGWRPVVWVSCR